MWRKGIGLGLVAAATVGACGDETPTSVGSELLGEELRTVRVVVDAQDFLLADTTYDGIGELNDASYGVVAEDFEATLDAYTLIRFTAPRTVIFRDSLDVQQTDSVESVIGASLRLVVDTLTDPQGSVTFELLDLTETWDPASVTWTSRVDSLGAPAEPWAVAGGTTGAVRATGTLSLGDTLVMLLDSATAAVWADSAAAQRGALLRLADPGRRLRLQAVNFTYDVRPADYDTIVPAGRVSGRASIASPDSPPAPGMLRVGGLPAWRSLVHFAPVKDLTVPCDAGSTTCEIPLSDVTVNAANLLLWSQPAGGRRPEGAMRVEGRAVLEAPTVPLTRSPLTQPFGRMDAPWSAEDFAAPAQVMSRVPITGFIQRNAAVSEEEDAVLWLALTAVGERSLFGYGEFGGIGSAQPPQLELVVTIPVQKVAP